MDLTKIIERSEHIQGDSVPDSDTVRDLAEMVMYLALHVKQITAQHNALVTRLGKVGTGI